ncbi:hypothetical protein EOD42_06625 [Rhodovarius crocodyli]|uniref:DUF2306 domain-containing protein n=1 Tax=Rhodovarius crocodyli TaxID=1979269 RepID=A0A437MIN3_9PROT|nr:DUF2306 domain-containing protein [Rhodovarius crocodyli]RVT97495.1 hypothetical protein EOD42_06625 [Rhodovarius crocodyli]
MQPLLSASPLVQIHAFAALAALGLGAWQLSRPKYGLSHRVRGWLWVGLMAVVALSAFGIRTHGGFSWIHLLAIFVLVQLPVAVLHMRRGRVRAHRNAMVGLFVGALVIAGAFTLLPGRIMHQLVFGG